MKPVLGSDETISRSSRKQAETNAGYEGDIQARRGGCHERDCCKRPDGSGRQSPAQHQRLQYGGVVLQRWIYCLALPGIARFRRRIRILLKNSFEGMW